MHYECPLVPTECPIHRERPDMTLVSLRPSSPGSTQYYLNMGVLGKLHCAILVNGKFWGMLVCHHCVGPKFVPFDLRIALTMTAEVFSLFVKMKEEERAQEVAAASGPARQRVLRMLEEGSGLRAALASLQSNIMDVMECDGASVTFGNKVHRFGTTPTSQQILALVEHVSTRDQGALCAADLSQVWPGAQGLREPSVGCLAQCNVAKSVADRVCLLWFRVPRDEEVSWGGDPSTSFTATGMRPRPDFSPHAQRAAIPAKSWAQGHVTVAREFMIEIGLRVEDIETKTGADLLANSLDTIQSPLTVVSGLAELCLQDPDLPDKFRDHVKMIHQSGTSVQALLKSVSDVDALESSRAEAIALTLEPVDVVQLARSCLRSFAQHFSTKGLRGRLVYSNNLPQMTLGLDKALLQQVTLNLISHGLRFTSKGTITVQLAYDQSLPELTVSMVDAGPGLEEEVGTQLFDKPVKLDSPGARESRAGDLSLYVVKRIADLMEGAVGVSSEEHQGCKIWCSVPASFSGTGPTTFPLEASGELHTEMVVTPDKERSSSSFPLGSTDDPVSADGCWPMGKLGKLFPRSSTTESAGLLPPQSPVSPSRDHFPLEYRGKVLFAGSDPAMQKFIATAVQNLALCVAVGDRSELLRKLQVSTAYQLILMDLDMPDMEAIETTKAVRSITRYDHIGIVGLTAAQVKSKRGACKAAGMADVVSKNATEVQTTVQTHLKRNEEAMQSQTEAP